MLMGLLILTKQLKFKKLLFVGWEHMGGASPQEPQCRGHDVSQPNVGESAAEAVHSAEVVLDHQEEARTLSQRPRCACM